MNYDWASDMHVRMGITTPFGINVSGLPILTKAGDILLTLNP